MSYKLRRKAPTTSQAAGLTLDEKTFLVHGWTEAGMKSPFPSEAVRRAAWEKYREEILDPDPYAEAASLFAGIEHFERPAAWWDFEAPELRRQLTGGPGSTDMHKGVPRLYDQAATFESEKDYLIRLDLLTETERGYAGQEF